MKRLRKEAKVPIRFFVCGEYGEQLSRPHYHACLFGYDFPDKKPVSYLSARPSWRSKVLDRLWPHGFCHLGNLNARSAAYAARYVLKKVCGRAAPEFYRRVDSDGVVHELLPEFARMSLRPGLGALWYDKFRGDVHTFDYCVSDGSRFAVPKYYDRLLERSEPDRLCALKEDREIRSLPFRPEGTPERLLVRETVETARIAQLKREFES